MFYSTINEAEPLDMGSQTDPKPTPCRSIDRHSKSPLNLLNADRQR
ncbi:MAG: hypothetical protein JGK29_16065 [Microcoleus sp. PH2017_17_BER_D_A]|nr:hypothetical protein [Microcoleus sp. PH2017_17_BER_D_A]